RIFDRSSRRYQGIVGRLIARPWRYMLVYLALASLMGLLFLRLPTAFLPDEDQGYLFTLVQAPVGATQARTMRALDQVQDFFLNQEKAAVESIFTVAGFSFSGGGQNAGIGFVLLKDWDERKSPALGVQALQGRAYRGLSQIKDALAFAFAPQFRLDIDAQKASSLGLSMNDVDTTLAVAWGGRYIDDFIDRGRVKHVIL